MPSFTAYGTSPYVTITAEQMKNHLYSGDSKVDLAIRPPVMGVGNAKSHAVNKWEGYWNHWAFEKITEPKYDGIADKIGQMSNQPDVVKDYHFIALMRTVSQLIRPEFKSNINMYTATPEPIKPNAPASGQGGS
jgi:hypothetical protein